MRLLKREPVQHSSNKIFTISSSTPTPGSDYDISMVRFIELGTYVAAGHTSLDNSVSDDMIVLDSGGIKLLFNKVG